MPVLGAPRTVRVGRAQRQQLGRDRARGRALARARRPVEQVRVRGLAARGRAERPRRRAGGCRSSVRRASREVSLDTVRRRDARATDHHRRLDGAGKTTLAVGPRRALRERGTTSSCCASRAASRLSERIRALVKDPALGVGARAEALLYAAARAQLVEERARAAAGRRALGAARPLRRLLARLPGRGARAGRRGGPTRSTRSPPAGACPTARCCCRSTRRRRARTRGRGDAADRLEREGRAFFARSRRPTTSWPPPSRQRWIRVIDATPTRPSPIRGRLPRRLSSVQERGQSPRCLSARTRAGGPGARPRRRRPSPPARARGCQPSSSRPSRGRATSSAGRPDGAARSRAAIARPVTRRPSITSRTV